MSWEKVKLGDIAEFSNGVNFDKSLYAPGVKLISVSNFGNRFYPDYSELSEISEDAVRKNDYLQHGDIVFVRSNGNKELVGRCMLIDNPPMHTTFSGFCIRARVKDTERFNPKFLTYHFKHDGFRIAMSGNAVGANIQNLSQGRLSAYIAYIPPIETQHRIADILSAYDDLIENNRKQIKLLEEAAQRLYKEWFVDLRFPGHEHTKIVDGVPEGWERLSVAQLGEFLNGFAFKPSDWQETGMPIIKIKEMGNGVSSDTPRNNGERVPEKYHIKAGDILFSWSATLSVMIWNGEDGWLNQHLFKVTPKPEISREFLLQSLARTIIEFSNLTTGATMKHIQRNKLEQVFVVVPPSEIMAKYQEIADPIRSTLLLLAKEINNLSEARDRLLPKLMSGEVEV